MGLRAAVSFWHRQKDIADGMRAAEQARTVPALDPIVAAEQARGNEAAGTWRQTSFGGPNGISFERSLRYPLDAEALRAEFEFDTKVWLRDNRAGSIDDAAMLLGGSGEPSAAQQAAREQWWAQWRAAPRAPRRLSEEAW